MPQFLFGQMHISMVLDNEDCFTVAPKTDHWELTVANNLPQTVVDDNISILLTLTATKSGVTVSGEAGLVVNMPQKVAASEFHFETNVYMGDYSTENELSIESDIVIDGVKRDDPKIDLTGGQYFHFDLSRNLSSCSTCRL